MGGLCRGLRHLINKIKLKVFLRMYHNDQYNMLVIKNLKNNQSIKSIRKLKVNTNKCLIHK